MEESLRDRFGSPPPGCPPFLFPPPPPPPHLPPSLPCMYIICNFYGNDYPKDKT